MHQHVQQLIDDREEELLVYGDNVHTFRKLTGALQSTDDLHGWTSGEVVYDEIRESAGIKVFFGALY
jgi:hypothetical protein